MDGTDVVVLEGGGRLGLADETSPGVLVQRQLRREEFERDDALQAGILGFVDLTHSAAAQLLNNMVMRYVFPDNIHFSIYTAFWPGSAIENNVEIVLFRGINNYKVWSAL